SYHPIVEAHFEAAEGYEHAQLIAEIGIVLASLGVLLASRPAWMISVALSLVCVFQLTRTNYHTRHVVTGSLVQVHHSEEAYGELRKSHVGANQDADAIERLDSD